MNITDLTYYKPKERKPAERTEPAAPRRSPVGPDIIATTIRELGCGWLRAWNDPMDRTLYYGEQHRDEIHDAHGDGKAITLTAEKLRGRWQITKLEAKE
jgi:hypothetical protein